MHKILLASVALTAGLATSAFAEMTVGVSWSNFQEERWKTDEAAIKGALEAAGAKYVSADAQSSSAKQLSDIEALYARRLLLQATAAAFGDTAEGRLLRAVDAWQTLGGRQRFYTEADADAMVRIAGSLTEASMEILKEIEALQGEIDSD